MALAWAKYVKNQDIAINRWHYRKSRKMAIDFKGFFEIKTASNEKSIT
jgi:hypothetical protein